VGSALRVRDRENEKKGSDEKTTNENMVLWAWAGLNGEEEFIFVFKERGRCDPGGGFGGNVSESNTIFFPQESLSEISASGRGWV